MSGPPGTRHGIRSRFRDLPVFLKLLVPFLVLMILLGALGGVLIVRDLSSRAQTALDQDLSRRSLEARSFLRDRELYLLESVNFAANLEGMADAMRARDRARATELLRSVVALKSDLDLVAAADTDGRTIVEFVRSPKDPAFVQRPGADRSSSAFVRRALADAAGAKAAGFVRSDGRLLFAVAGAICSAVQPCAATGVTIVGIDVETIAAQAAGQTRAGVAMFDTDGRKVASAGRAGALIDRAESAADGLVRRTQEIGGEEVATVFAAMELQGRRQGTVAVTVPTAPSFASVRGAGGRLALVLLAGLVGIIGIGVVVSRFILAQVRPLAATNRALGEGDLTARAPVLGNDELGQLAAGVNQMAEQLEASVETLETRVEERTEEVRRLLRERTEFFAALSHEFRTPLAVILRQADLLLDPRTPKTSRWSFESGRTLKQSGHQLLALINEILELAKAEVGGLEVTLERVRLGEVIDEAKRTIEGLAKGAGLSVSIRIPRNLPAIQADRVRVREIVLNLIDNAVKYTPKGGRIALVASARNGHVEVCVSDTGVGIPEDAQDRIFEPFFRVGGIKTQKGQPATGLGLAITKRLVEAHGGDITFTSEPGAGSTFTFTLPLSRARAR